MADLNFAGSYDGLHLPYSPEAEQAVLGAIILESDTFDKVVDTLKSPDYFYVSLHKLIFAQMQDLCVRTGQIIGCGNGIRIG